MHAILKVYKQAFCSVDNVFMFSSFRKCLLVLSSCNAYLSVVEYILGSLWTLMEKCEYLWFQISSLHNHKPRHAIIGHKGFQPRLTQTSLYNHRRRIEALNVRCKKKTNFTICVSKIE